MPNPNPRNRIIARSATAPQCGSNPSRRSAAGLIALSAVVLALMAAPVHGSLVVLMNLEELVGASDSIVEGVVEAVESRWEDQQIFTYTTIRIDDPLKGNRTRTVVIRQLGGRVGALMAIVPGMPQFDTGLRVIVFLKDSGNGSYYVVGMNQGRYVIAEDYAVSNLTGLDLVDPKTGVRGVATASRVEVESLKARIRELVR